MRHLKKHNKLRGPASYRRAVIVNLCKSLIKYGRIKTTKAKAKLVRPVIEKLVTKAKTNTIHSKRIVASRLKSWEFIPALFDQVAPKFKSRPGGYTRIIKLGFRGSDSAEMVLLEFLEEYGGLKVKQDEIQTEDSKLKPKEKIKTKANKKEDKITK